MKTYDCMSIEEKWLARWEAAGLFQGSAAADPGKDPLYLLFAFAYPSGSGLHVGHVESKTALDILARFNRMQGRQVFFPVGWDAFGLPAENYAIKTGVPPAETTRAAIDTFRRQIKRLAISYDWQSEIATSHPGYYRWTQWLFLQLYKEGLAYRGQGMVNWCPSCQTVLANEQVVDGECERCGSEVVQKSMEQWYFQISKYRDELISGLDAVDWPAATKQQQLNWIGKSEGAVITFHFADREQASQLTIDCFTTRLDTIFGVTYVVLSPEKATELQLIEQVPAERKSAVEMYLKMATLKTEEQRRIGEKDKTGVDTGLSVINPASGSHVPVFIADYVLGGYGTGAVMGVPAHDERDLAFAKKHNLGIQPVILKDRSIIISYLMGGEHISDEDLTAIGVRIAGTDGDSRMLEIPADRLAAYQDLIRAKLSPGFWNEYIGVQTGFIFKHTDGTLEEFSRIEPRYDRIVELCAQFANEKVENVGNLWSYLLQNPWYREWLLHSEKGELFNSEQFSGMSSEEVISDLIEQNPEHIKLTTTYKLRDWLISRQRYWGAPIPIVYDPEGNPHAVKDEHLPWLLPTDVDFKPTGESPLRSSKEFVERTERLYGKGWRPEFDTMDTFVDSSWYYLRYVDARNESAFADQAQLAHWLPVDFYMIGPEHIVLHLLYSRFFTKFLRDQGHLKIDEPFTKMRHQGMILGPDGKKMSKSKGNVINPDDVIEKFGADTLRVYEMFMGPIESDKPWDVRAVAGVYRFLNRIYDLCARPESGKAGSPVARRKLHQTIRKVTGDISAFKYNTAIAALMELVNVWEAEVRSGNGGLTREERYLVAQIIAPFAPFLAEELGEMSGVSGCIHTSNWPAWDESLAAEESVTIAIQVNGKVRATVQVPSQHIKDKDAVLSQARALEQLVPWLAGTVKREIYVPGKIVNFVVS